MKSIASPLRPARPGAADAVHVGLGVVGHVVVHDVADPLDVEAARGDVRRDQDVELSALDARHRALAVLLLHVAVQRRGSEAPRLESLGQLDGRLLGAREHEHAVEGLRLEDARQRVELVHAAHDPVALPDVGGGAGLAGDRDLDRLAQVLLGDAADRGRQRRREQGDLPGGRCLLEDPLDVVDEAHLQHLVGFVEHDAGDAAEVQRAALDVVHHAARSADHDVSAALQAHQLRRVALPAIDRQHMESLDPGRILLEGFGHLDREFARRHEHDDLRRAAPDLDATQQRQRKGGGLAGAGLRLADHVLAGQQHGDGGGLDRRRRLVADLRQRLEDWSAETQVAECGGDRFGGRCLHGKVLGVGGRIGGRFDKPTRTRAAALPRGRCVRFQSDILRARASQPDSLVRGRAAT